MKYRIMILFVACGLVLAGFSMTAIGEAEQSATEETLDTAQAVAEEAIETAEQALEAVEEVSEELEAAGEAIQEAEAAAAEAEEAVAAAEATAAPEAEVEVAEAAAELEALAGPSADSMQEAMAAWMQIATPGEHHAKLDPFVGQWDVTTSMWFAPGMPPQVNKGTSEIKWILDGRFIQENFQGQMQMPGAEPQKFMGMGITGYDNAKGQYIGTWTDTMSTAAISSTGQFDEATQTLTMSSEFDCPMSGPSSMRMVIGMVNTDEFLLQAYKTVEGQEEAKCMEITYTRKP